MRNGRTLVALKSARKLNRTSATVRDPYEVLRAYSRRRVRFMTGLIKPSDGDFEPVVLVEGDKATLECLGNIFLAVANDEDCGFFLSPKREGSSLFVKKASVGIYIHRLPCVNQLMGGKSRSPVIGSRKLTKLYRDLVGATKSEKIQKKRILTRK